MKKKLLLLLCLIVTAGSATRATTVVSEVQTGVLSNGGTWKMDPHTGVLEIHAKEIPNFSSMYYLTGINVTNAPWNQYRSIVKSIELYGVSKIGDYSFMSFKRLLTVNFHEKTSADVVIGRSAFKECYFLYGFNFDYVKEIQTRAFESCVRLETITLPNIQKIEKNAFDNCVGLWHRETPSIWLTGNKLPVIGDQQDLTGSNYYLTDSETGEKLGQTVYCGYKVNILVTNSTLKQNLKNYFEQNNKHFGWEIAFGGRFYDHTTDYYWMVTDDQEDLTIHAYDMPDYGSESETPWSSVRSSIRFINIERANNIGNNAFKGFSKLVDVNINNNMKISVGNSAFEGCNKLWFFPFKNVTSIGSRAFAGTTDLQGPQYWQIEDMTNVTEIGESAFANSRLHKARFKKLTSIGSKAFQNAKSLEDIYMGGTAPTASSNAFDGLTLSDITLHIDDKVYGSYAGKAPWKDFTIDRDIKYPVGGIFEGGFATWELTEDGTMTISMPYYVNTIANFDKPSDQPWYNYRTLINKIELASNITGIGKNAFACETSGMSNLTSIEAPSVTTIGDNAFQNNDVLRSFTGEKVQTIGNYAFAGCAAIQDYKFGSDLKTIGKNAFDGCANVDVMSLTAATPPEVSAETFQGIGSSSGSQGTRLRAATGQSGIRLDVPEQYITKYLGNLYWRMFSYYVGEHGNVVKTGKYYDGLWVIYSDGTLIASSDTSEGDIEGFYNDATVKRVELLGNATQLNWTGFNKLPNVEEIVLSPAMVTLGDEVFMGLSKLKNINLEMVQTIGRRVFKGCSKLQYASMASAKEIGINAFEDCTSLDSVTVTGDTKLNYYLFKGCTALKTADLSGMNIHSNTSGIFEGCTKLESVTLKAFALSVSTNMFKDCQSLTSINLGGDCRIIYSNAFTGTNLTTIYSASATPAKIQDGAFGDLMLSNITAYVPADYVRLYKKANGWKDMNIQPDPDWTESIFPQSGPVGDNGVWKLDAQGTLTISYDGAMPNGYRGVDSPWYNMFDRWMPFIENVIYTDGITAIAENVTNKEAEAGFYDGVKTVEIGADVKYIRGNAMRYSGLTDVYCFAIEPPSMVYSQSEDMSFDFPALKTNNCTLHVPDFYGTLDKYKSSYMWKDFPRIVADLPTRKPGTIYVESLALKPDAKHLAILPDELGSYTYQIEPVIYPACADNKVLTWTSDDESVATVDENGLVTILAYPIDYNIVTISAVTTDGSNKRATCELFIYNPEEVQGGIPATDLAINRTSITLLKSSKSTVKVSLTPANSNSYVSTMIEGQGTIDVFEMFDPMTGVTQRNVFEITPRDLGTFVITFQATDVDWEQVSEYPTAVLTVNVIDDVIFTEKSAEGVPVTYIVNSLDENTCSLYGKREQEIWVDPETGIPTWGEETYYTAVDTETKGDVTIPTKAGGYFVVGVSNLAFRNCNQLTAIAFDEGIQFIGDQAFEGCESLREVYLPSTIQGFGINCFAMLSELGDVYVFGQTPPVGGFEYNNYWYGEAESSMAFDGIYTIDEEKGATLHVPVGCREAWDIYPWNMWFRNIVEDAVDGVETIDNGQLIIDNQTDSWYDLSGRKLGSKPTKSGLYIMNGKKIVIK